MARTPRACSFPQHRPPPHPSPRCLAQGKEASRRNAHLARLGLTLPGERGAEHLPEAELKKREQAWAAKKEKLKSPNFLVSATRLSVRSLPTQVGEAELKKLALWAAAPALRGEEGGAGADDGAAAGGRGRGGRGGRGGKGKGGKGKGPIRHVKIIRDEDRRDARGEFRSKGFGFVEFFEHAHALACLKTLADNSNALEVLGIRNKVIITTPFIPIGSHPGFPPHSPPPPQFVTNPHSIFNCYTPIPPPFFFFFPPPPPPPPPVCHSSPNFLLSKYVLIEFAIDSVMKLRLHEQRQERAKAKAAKGGGGKGGGDGAGGGRGRGGGASEGSGELERDTGDAAARGKGAGKAGGGAASQNAGKRKAEREVSIHPSVFSGQAQHGIGSDALKGKSGKGAGKGAGKGQAGKGAGKGQAGKGAGKGQAGSGGGREQASRQAVTGEEAVFADLREEGKAVRKGRAVKPPKRQKGDRKGEEHFDKLVNDYKKKLGGSGGGISEWTS